MSYHSVNESISLSLCDGRWQDVDDVEQRALVVLGHEHGAVVVREAAWDGHEPLGVVSLAAQTERRRIC